MNTRSEIGAIPKNREGSRLVVAVQGSPGNRVIDVREFIGRTSTNHGLTVSADEWRQIITLVSRALNRLEDERFNP